MDERELCDMAVDFVISMMRSVPEDTIRALDWWPRAKAALATAANRAESVKQIVTEMARKLQIPAVRNETANFISSLDKNLTNADDFKAFRRLCRYDAVFIVAMAQAKRDEQKRAKKTEKETKR